MRLLKGRLKDLLQTWFRHRFGDGLGHGYGYGHEHWDGDGDKKYWDKAGCVIIEE